MTTDQSDAEIEAAGPPVFLTADVNAEPDFDPVLQYMVGKANAANVFELGITLDVSGITISGKLIPYRAYLDALQAEITESGKASPEKARFDAFASDFADYDRKAIELNGGEVPDSRHIHLKDAVCWAPGSRSTLPVGLWRGRLSHVSGWSLGEFAPLTSA